MLRSMPQNQAYSNRTVDEARRNLSSIFNPSASQNASYQLERKRFLEGEFQKAKNEAVAAAALDKVLGGSISRAMGLPEGADTTALQGLYAYSDKPYQSAQGYTELGEGADRRRSANILMSPDADFTDTERIGAGTVQTGKYMGRDDVISAPMKDAMLETQKELENQRIANDLALGKSRISMERDVGMDSNQVAKEIGLAGVSSDEKIGLAGIASQEKVALDANQVEKLIGLDGNAVEKAVGLDKNMKVLELGKLALKVEKELGIDANDVLEKVGLNKNLVTEIVGKNKNATYAEVEKLRIQSDERVGLDYNKIRKEIGLDANVVDRAVRLDANAVQKAVGLNKNLTLVEIAKLAEDTAFKLGIDKNKVLEKIGLDENQITKLIGQDKNIKWSEVEKIRAENEKETRLKEIIVGEKIGLDKNAKWREVQMEKNKNEREVDELIAANQKEVDMAGVAAEKEVGLDKNLKNKEASDYRWDVDAQTERWKHNNREISLKALPGQRLVVDRATGVKLGITPDEDGLYVFEAGPDPSKPYKVVVGEGQIAYVNEQTALELGLTKNEDGTYSVPGRVKMSERILFRDPGKDVLEVTDDGVKTLKEGRLSQVLKPGDVYQSVVPSDESQDITLSNRLPGPEPLSQNVQKKEPKPIDTRSAQSDYYKDFTNQMMVFESGDEEDIKERIAEGGSAIEGMSQMVKKNLERKTLKRLEELLQDRQDTRGYATKFQQAFEETVGTDQPVKVDGIAIPSALHKILMAGVNDPRMPATLTDEQYKSVRKTYGKILKGYKYTESEIDDIIEELFD